MKFSTVAEAFEKMEGTASRLELTALFAHLLSKAFSDEVAPLCYLSLGRLGPKFDPLEFSLSDKLILRSLSVAFDVPVTRLQQQYKKEGDLGETAFQLRSKIKEQRSETRVKTSIPTLHNVYEELFEIAEDSGMGSQDRKIVALARLLQKLDSLGAKYVVRIIMGKLRLGFSDVTILDALSVLLTGDKSAREIVERAYNLSADIGFIAEVAKEKGLAGLMKVHAQVGVPIRTAMAERLPNPAAIVEKLTEFAVEAKYDGFRVQIHLNAIDQKSKIKDQKHKLKVKSNTQLSFVGEATQGGPLVRIFSRNLEDLTGSFPDIVKAVQKLPVKRAIFDAEAIAYNPDTEEFLAFQETVQRRRKHNIASKQKEIPLRVFVFDLLYLDDTDLLEEPFEKRRQLLEKMLGESPHADIVLTHQDKVSSEEGVLRLFNLYVSEGLEGVMCKKLDSIYQAGARNFNWIKYKRIESGELQDTIDAVVLGYYRGRGRRAGFGIGAFLVGVSADEKSKGKSQLGYVTIAKIGTGVTDEMWGILKKGFDEYKVGSCPPEYSVDKSLNCDVWVRPAIIVEIRADEITNSPNHSSGFALRFPRLVRLREDREEPTTLDEIKRLYEIQPMHGNK